MVCQYSVLPGEAKPRLVSAYASRRVGELAAELDAVPVAKRAFSCISYAGYPHTVVLFAYDKGGKHGVGVSSCLIATRDRAGVADDAQLRRITDALAP